jgi:hypothetical protein
MFGDLQVASGHEHGGREITEAGARPPHLSERR